jgi:hypothetical protein
MRRIIIMMSIGLFLSLGLCFAEEESLTITTYYPSPYGSYNELQSNKVAIGDTNDDGQLTADDQPSTDGNIRLKPQSGSPDDWSSGEIGEIAYSSSEDALYHYNGSEWVAQTGGGGCYTNYGGSTCANGYEAVLTGYSTVYYTWIPSVSIDAYLVCSSVKHEANFDATYPYVLASSRNKYIEGLVNEPCCICCK